MGPREFLSYEASRDLFTGQGDGAQRVLGLLFKVLRSGSSAPCFLAGLDGPVWLSRWLRCPHQLLPALSSQASPRKAHPENPHQLQGWPKQEADSPKAGSCTVFVLRSFLVFRSLIRPHIIWVKQSPLRWGWGWASSVLLPQKDPGRAPPLSCSGQNQPPESDPQEPRWSWLRLSGGKNGRRGSWPRLQSRSLHVPRFAEARSQHSLLRPRSLDTKGRTHGCV